ncbi:MAG: hypothetical protein AAFS03_08605 [Pseudomonadota bacterium]
MKKSRLMVTDGALLGYLAIQWGIDVEALRDLVAETADNENVPDTGRCALLKNRSRFEIKDGTVVAVRHRNPRKQRHRK